MTPEIFEGIMLVCFGLAWPLSIYKTLNECHSGSAIPDILTYLPDLSSTAKQYE